MDSQPKTPENEPVKNDYAQSVEWISCGFGFFGSGLIALFPFYVFSFSLTDFSTLFFYAFLVGFSTSKHLTPFLVWMRG